MNKKNIIILILVIFVMGVVSGLIYLNTDSMKFKREYESLNNTKAKDVSKYNNISISMNNPIKYISAKEAVDIIENKSGIIYFGANWCPWCRNALPVLFESAKKYKVNTIYYVDMNDVRNIWEVKNDKLIKTQKEGKGYSELLISLDEVLGEETYKLTDNDKEYDTKEKRIYLPFVVEIKNGNIMNSHVGTVELNENQSKFDKLTKKQHKELLKIYDSFMDDLTTSGKCDDDTKCN